MTTPITPYSGTVPSRGQSGSVFAAAMNALLAWIVTMVPQMNTAIAALNFNSTNSVSTTSLTIGTGSQTLTVEAGKSYVVGMGIRIAYTTDATRWMHGYVTAYNSGTGALTASITSISTSGGTYAAWTTSLASAESGSVYTDASGNVGIGAASGGAKLYVHGTERIRAAADQTMNIRGSVSLANAVVLSAENDAGTLNIPLEVRFLDNFSLYGNSALRLNVDSTGHITPGADNTQNFGSASFRLKEIFAGTGTINTSDSREKTPVSALSAAEIAAAKELSQAIGGFKWLASVAEKGEAAARKHIGLTVQQAVSIMEAHGLDPFGYGFICYDEWTDKFVEHPAQYEEIEIPAVLDAGGNEIVPAHFIDGALISPAWTEQVLSAGNRYGFRHDQLLMFITAGFEARLAALEAV